MWVSSEAFWTTLPRDKGFVCPHIRSNGQSLQIYSNKSYNICIKKGCLSLYLTPCHLLCSERDWEHWQLLGPLLSQHHPGGLDKVCSESCCYFAPLYPRGSMESLFSISAFYDFLDSYLGIRGGIRKAPIILLNIFLRMLLIKKLELMAKFKSFYLIRIMWWWCRWCRSKTLKW